MKGIKNILVGCLAIVWLEGCSTPAHAEGEWSRNEKLGEALQTRHYLTSKQADVLKDNLDNVIGRIVVIKDKQGTELTTFRILEGEVRPAVLKLEEAESVYKSILDSDIDLSATFPFLGIKWGGEEKAQITLDDIARIVVDPNNLPSCRTFQDKLGAIPTGIKVGWIEAARLSSLRINRLKKQTGGLTGLLSFLNIGGNRYVERNEDRWIHLISLVVINPFPFGNNVQCPSPLAPLLEPSVAAVVKPREVPAIPGQPVIISDETLAALSD